MHEIERYVKYKTLIRSGNLKDFFSYIGISARVFDSIKIGKNKLDCRQYKRMLYFFGDDNIEINPENPYEKLALYIVDNNISWSELGRMLGVKKNTFQNQYKHGFTYITNELIDKFHDLVGIEPSEWNVMEKGNYNGSNR